MHKFRNYSEIYIRNYYYYQKFIHSRFILIVVHLFVVRIFQAAEIFANYYDKAENCADYEL